MSLKDIATQVIRELIDEGKTEFIASEVYERALQIDPNVKRFSMFSTLHTLCKGSQAPYVKDEEKILEKVSRATYRLAPPPPPPTPKQPRRGSSRRSRR